MTRAVPVRFTVAIPTHDRRETVLLAIASALAQTRPPEEVLVLCDGCTDGTPEAVAALDDPRVRALDLPKAHGYGYAHRNRSLEEAAGDVITWLGDDDLFLPDHLERIGALWDGGEVDVVTAPAAVVAPDDAVEWVGTDWSEPYFARDLERANSHPMSSVSIRVATARAAGGWDAALPRAADWDLWRRALASGARPAATDVPTVLHFRATGRDQAWPDRVRQNTEWGARLRDPDALRSVRARLARLRTEHQARWDAYGRELRAAVDWHEEQLANARAAQAAAEAESARLAQALGAIEAGGWWRLRGRLRRLARRGP